MTATSRMKTAAVHLTLRAFSAADAAISLMTSHLTARIKKADFLEEIRKKSQKSRNSSEATVLTSHKRQQTASLMLSSEEITR